MRWSPELPIRADAPREEWLEWLVRQFDKISDWSEENAAGVAEDALVPVIIGRWTFAGVGTGLATAPGTFRADSATHSSITALRFNRFNANTDDTTISFTRLKPQDRVFIQQNLDAAQAGLYELNTIVTIDPGGDIIMNNLTMLQSAGTAAGVMLGAVVYRA